MAQLLLGIDVNNVSPQEAIQKISPRPVLLVHSIVDRTIPFEHAQLIYEAGNKNHVKLWIVDEADHVAIYTNRRIEYIEQIVGFFNTALSIPD